jgi:hypothetical protein
MRVALQDVTSPRFGGMGLGITGIGATLLFSNPYGAVLGIAATGASMIAPSLITVDKFAADEIQVTRNFSHGRYSVKSVERYNFNGKLANKKVFTRCNPQLI